MGTYYIPRNLKGNSRILYIFTIKSLIYTAIGAGIGLVLYFIFATMLQIKPLGIGLLAIFAVSGFAIGTIKIPRFAGIPFTKNIAGDSLDEIIKRYLLFKSNRKVYSYAVPKDEVVHETNDLLKKFTGITKEDK